MKLVGYVLFGVFFPERNNESKCILYKKIHLLSDTGFVKEADGYYQGSKHTHRRTRCQLSSGSPSVLTFTKVYKNF